MELYSKTMLHDLQTVVNSGNYELTSYNSYDGTFLGESNKLFSNGITLSFKADGGRRYMELYIPNSGVYEGIGNKYLTEWRDTAVGKFMKKDWRDETKDLLGNIIYHQISFTMPSGDVVGGVIRDLVEYYDEASDETRNILKRKYGDLLIDGHWYSVIKLWDAAKPHSKTMTLNTFGSYMDETLKNEDYTYSALTSDEESEQSQNEKDPACEQLF